MIIEVIIEILNFCFYYAHIGASGDESKFSDRNAARWTNAELCPRCSPRTEHWDYFSIGSLNLEPVLLAYFEAFRLNPNHAKLGFLFPHGVK